MKEIKEMQYNPILLGFVCDVSMNYLENLKKNLIDIAKNLEAEEKVYLYHPAYNMIPRWPGQSVGMIANYSHCNINTINAIKKIINLWENEDSDSYRHLFYFTDRQINPNRIKNILKVDSISFLNKPIEFFLCSTIQQKKECEFIKYVNLESMSVYEIIKEQVNKWKK